MLQRNKSQTASGIRLDRRDLESRAKSIEQSLSALESHTSRSSSSASSSKVSAHQLVNSLSDAINEIISSGSELERDNMSSELNAELTRLSETGRDLIRTAAEFADEPSSAAKKTKLAASSKLLLQSLARLLAIADLLDAHAIRPLIDSIACALRSMSEMRSIEAFLPAFKRYNDDLKSLINLCSIAIQNLSDQHMKNDLASSLGQLAKQSLFLYTSSKIYLKHQNSNIASSLHEQVYKESIECISKIEEIFSNQYKPDLAQLKPFTIGLVDKFNNLEKHVAELNPTDQNELKKRQKFENQVEDIIKSINTFASKDLILPERKNRIMDEANTMKMSLHAFFDSYSDNAKKNNSKMHENIQNEFGKIIKSLKRQLRKAVIEKVSTMSTNEILDELIFAAQSNQNGGLSQALASFESHAKVWSDLSQMACALSSNQEGIKMAKMARKQLDALLPYVLSSAQIYASFGAESKEASENMQVIRSRWLSQCEILQLSIDDIVCINDFLAVYEYQLHRELNKCIGSLGNLLSGTGANELKTSAHQVATKVGRIGEMIEAEMNNYEPCAFTSRVLESINSLSTRLLPSFSHSVEALDHELSSSTYGTVSASNENELIEYARLIYDSVRDMRSALFMIPGGGVEGGEMVDYSADFDDEYDEHLRQQQDRSSLYCMDEAIGDVDEKSQVALTDEQREKINAELSSLRKEKTNFDREVLKWDDQSNEIVVLAKQIAVIMMDMVKFTRGVGPYKTTLDIINAAKRINEIGLKLEKLCRKLASECPESQSKKELISYLNALPLFCNQLSIGTRVQENIIDPNTAKHLMLITSATSLIISSKNLMNTVISVVKSSYVASTKYSSKTDNKKPIVQWRMKPPELKPLVTKSKAPETADLIRKATKAVAFSPIKTLSEFQG